MAYKMQCSHNNVQFHSIGGSHDYHLPPSAGLSIDASHTDTLTVSMLG